MSLDPPAANSVPPDAAAARRTPFDTELAQAGAGLSLRAEHTLLSRLRLSQLRAAIWHKIKTSRLRLSLIVVLSISFWIGLYVLFHEGFVFLANFGDLKPSIFNTYFSALMMMLTISSGLIMYGGLFRSTEMRWLLTQPLSGNAIFHHKYQETIWFTGWGFLLTSTPMLVAAGVSTDAPWYYYALMLPFLVSFLYIPVGCGALVCVLVVYFLPRRRMLVLVGAIAIFLGYLVWVSWSALAVDQQDFTSRAWWANLGERLQYTEQRFLPSYWLSAGLINAQNQQSELDLATQPWSESLLFLGVLISNALMTNLVAAYLAGPLVREAYQKLQVMPGARGKFAPSARQPNPWRRSRWLWFFPRDLRVLIHKEWRIFHRDPLQWLQVVLFFGLLVLYLLNLRRFPYEREYSALIGFLNLAVVGLILSTFTTRFIYPMISLEGQRFWILNLLPVDRGAILMAKFLFASLGSWIPCALLIGFSDWMLDLPQWLMLLHQLSCLQLCWGLAGLAVGLGAIMPDLREESPSKIAAGFGGTLNLVISASYILLIVLIAAIPCQLWIIRERGIMAFQPDSWITWLGGTSAIILSQGVNLLLMLAATLGVMWLGIQSFRKYEF
ncbi:MAG: hypothetical protein SFX18_10260 [Pirellulales bacterium]|nr:hypothetical protein [Pirellulales bacterium]